MQKNNNKQNSKTNRMANEKDYLTRIESLLMEEAHRLSALDSDEVDVESVLPFIQDLIKQEASLREQAGIGSRFLVLQSQLQQIEQRMQGLLDEQTRAQADETQQIASARALQDNELVVYVYLYNAHGLRLSSWERFLAQHALDEHSVNRPVYARMEDVEALLRNKNHPQNHGVLKVKVSRDDVALNAQESQLRDLHGNVLLRLRESALKQKNILAFICKGKEYHLDGHKLLEI